MNNYNYNSKQNTLLIVEDEIVNLNILINYLRDQYNVQVARDGKEALLQANNLKPDLILMDVRMPKLDGFETCRRLKNDRETSDIPVVFMTSLTDTEDKIKGFEVGAVDYITKPIQYKEVLARISAQLGLRNLQVILEQQKLAIEQKNLELEVQNMELNAFAQIVVNDLKKPLIRQAGFTNILKKELANKESLNFLQEIDQSRHEMVDVVDDMVLLINIRTQEVVVEAPDMVSIVAGVRHKLTSLINKYNGTIIAPPSWPIVWGYSPWIETVWEIYITNALLYGGKPPKVELGFNSDDKQIKFWVRDNGRGFTDEQQKKLFAPMSDITKVEAELGKGYGLKLSIVRLIIEKCGGEIGVKSRVGRGSLFYFTLPGIG
ncbi:MAG: hybrid sensor histidine kinase/response regulator [Proteobacteria bacterium]|nr:hybrid sensor histidine kinase/response regulator [Pseudomonadota bacterium]